MNQKQYTAEEATKILKENPGVVAVDRKFRSWTVLSALPSKNERGFSLCVCKCGTVKAVRNTHLRSGASTSCGCKGFKHGRTANSGIYKSWRAMKERCLNPKNISYSNYGGRGISVCERWLNSFTSFLEDMGDRPTPTHSIGRIDVNGNYEPGNCRWETSKEQGQNKRNSSSITMNGKTQTLEAWCNELSISISKARVRIEIGWAPVEAIIFPSYQCNVSKEPTITRVSVVA